MNVTVTEDNGFQWHSPENKLERKAVIPGPPGIDYEAIARAEKALAELSENFASWMVEECENLRSAQEFIHAEGANGETLEKMFHVAHDIKGQAPTLGYPLASGAAASLCRLLLDIPRPERAPVVLIDQHVETICTIVRDNITNIDDKTTVEVSKRLLIVVEDFLEQEQEIYDRKFGNSSEEQSEE